MDPTKKPSLPTDGTEPASNVDYFLAGLEEPKKNGPGLAAAGKTLAPATSGHFLDLPEN
jgi:pilus assembly protein CpaC